MGSLLVVILDPIGTDAPDLVQILEEVGIEHFLTVGTAESFDVGILVGLTRLNISRLDPVAFAPTHKRLGNGSIN